MGATNATKESSRRITERQMAYFGHDVFLVVPGEDRAIKARVVDISSDGIGIEVSESLPVGSDLRMFSLSISISARIMWCDEIKRWGRKIYRVGLKAKKHNEDLRRTYAHVLGS